MIAGIAFLSQRQVCLTRSWPRAKVMIGGKEDALKVVF